jgi:endonuclease YncB( thermonuclease family)
VPARSALGRLWRRLGYGGQGAAVALGTLAGLAILSAGLTGSGGSGCRILAVIDGDTVSAFCPGEGLVRARLEGFDTPESWDPRCLSEWWAGRRATLALRWKLLAAGEIETVLSGSDRYGRRLMTLFLDGENVARAMIAEGHARPYAGGPRAGWCGPAAAERPDRPDGARFVRPPAG